MVKIRKFGVKLINDNENSLEYVIHTLMDLFSWDITQAANCVYIVDRKGEYVIKWVENEDVAYHIAKVLTYKRLNVDVVTSEDETLEA
jgi:ATP-dependent Clp protease adapter protein ClpS